MQVSKMENWTRQPRKFYTKKESTKRFLCKVVIRKVVEDAMEELCARNNTINDLDYMVKRLF